MTPTGCQLITYPDSLGGSLAALERLVGAEFADLFPGGVHVLPPFPSSGDRGFAPITYFEIDPAFGDWDDLRRVAAHGGVMVDIMVNHISRRSPQFLDFERFGRESPTGDMFITVDKVWPDGTPAPGDVAKIFLRKPEHPFSDITVESTGAVEQIWTTFSPRVDWSEQVDLDITSPVTWDLYDRWFAHLAANGVTAVRLDAIGYVTKRAGTSCFMVEPEIWTFFEDITTLAASHRLAVVPEVHDTRAMFEAITARGYQAYNFALPGLILDAVLTGDGHFLRQELLRCPANQVTMLDCHDGIPVQPDLIGLLPEPRMRAMVDTCLARGANLNRILGAPAGSFDAHQINITYPDACGSDAAYLAARAIQLFAPGTPQVYYVGLLAGSADLDAVAATGEGRAINRHDYTDTEIAAALAAPVVAEQRDLIRLRNTHPAFAGSCMVLEGSDAEVGLEWRAGEAVARLLVDLAASSYSVDVSG